MSWFERQVWPEMKGFLVMRFGKTTVHIGARDFWWGLGLDYCHFMYTIELQAGPFFMVSREVSHRPERWLYEYLERRAEDRSDDDDE